MALLEELRQLGVDTEEGLGRLGGNEALYIKLLGSFTSTLENHYVQPDFDENDYTDIIEKTHSLKGTSGNLSITPLYEAYTEIVALLRAGEPKQAKQVLEKVLPVQEEIVQCIKNHG